MELETNLHVTILQHMVIGGLPLLGISIVNYDPVFSGSFQQLSANDWLALLYTSIFGSAISYGVYFYSATKGCFSDWKVLQNVMFKLKRHLICHY